MKNVCSDGKKKKEDGEDSDAIERQWVEDPFSRD